MASWKQRKFNQRLLDLFIESFALDQTWVKNHPSYDELSTWRYRRLIFTRTIVSIFSAL
jgi:hypothetical protein